MASLRTTLAHRIAAAQGKRPCDILVKGVTYLDVFTCSWKTGDIGIADGVIVGLEPGLKAARTVEGKGKWLVPGFVDAHCHVESSMVLPAHFEQMVLPHGTTTALCDPHELANVQGASGIEYFLEASQQLKMDLWVMLSSCVPATPLETNGGGTLDAQVLQKLAHHPKALGLAEVMSVPLVLEGESGILAKLEAFQDLPIDGHLPLATGKALAACAAAGIATCHESSRLEEAQEKLTHGVAVWIREGSVAKDLQALVPLLTVATSTSMGFCTDDRNPLDIAEEGHLDHCIRNAIAQGVVPEVAYRAASWSVARHYGLEKGIYRIGAIAPGYQADLALLEDLQTCAVGRVFKAGVDVADLPQGAVEKEKLSNTLRCAVPEVSDLEGPEGMVHVIGVEAGKILTNRSVERHNAVGVARLTVLERYGRGLPPANGYVFGFGQKFQGAIASSVGHDSHNLIAVGREASDLQVAFAALVDMGGGFCVVEKREVLARLPLPIGGLMSNEDPSQVCKALRELKEASRYVGCELPEPFLQLAFLSLPVIPSLKLTDRGLVDVALQKIIPVRV